MLGCLISFLAVLWLWKAVGFSDLRSVDVKPDYRYLVPFLFLVLLIAVLTSVRWKQLLDGRLDLQLSFVAALLRQPAFVGAQIRLWSMLPKLSFSIRTLAIGPYRTARALKRGQSTGSARRTGTTSIGWSRSRTAMTQRTSFG